MNGFGATHADLLSLAPELLLGGLGVLILLLDAFAPALRRLFTPLVLAGVVVAGWWTWTLGSGPSFGGLIESSPATIAFCEIVLIATMLAVLASDGYLRRERLGSGEYQALMLWCVVGLFLLVRSTELLMIFLALELLSIGLYALAAYHRRLSLATESALKYFLMGAFVSAFVLYGIAILYGETRSTHLDAIADALRLGHASPTLTTLALLMLVAGFGFKMSLAPFHAWAPDAYQGAPSPYVAFLSVAPKAASAMVMMRLLQVAMAGSSPRWPALFAILAVLSMVAGNLLALVQRDIKRMLAYSGVAHMGYLLIPFAADRATAWQPVLLYLLAYALMNAGAFAVITLLYARPGEQHLVSELSGWGYRYPLLGVCLTVCMLSLGGIPPTLGFLGKYQVFLHAIRHGRVDLALIGVVASLVGVFYYLRVVYVLYMKPEVAAPEGVRIDLWGRLAVVLAAGGTLVLGIWPAAVLDWMRGALGP